MPETLFFHPQVSCKVRPNGEAIPEVRGYWTRWWTSSASHFRNCHPPIGLTHRKAQGYKLHEAYINIYKRLFTPARVN